MTAARFPAPERLVAIGDLHGQLEAARAALRLAGAIDEANRWIGGKLVVVQTGDAIDRGDHDREVLDLLHRLTGEAQAAGGALHALLGNHETLNVDGDFRLVSQASLAAFAGVAAKAPGAERFEEDRRPRAEAFLPGGEYAQRLSRQDIVAVVGDTVFSHAGIVPRHVAYGLDRANAEVRDWIAGRAARPALVMEKPSPLWNRLYGQPQLPEQTCRDLRTALQAVGARRMVVGHTIQDDGITSACDGQVWRIDVGLYQRDPRRPVQVLEIRGDRVEVLTAPSATQERP